MKHINLSHLGTRFVNINRCVADYQKKICNLAPKAFVDVFCNMELLLTFW